MQEEPPIPSFARRHVFWLSAIVGTILAGAGFLWWRVKHRKGKTSALQLIVAEDIYSNARLGYVRAIGQRLLDTAQLFVSVGGGWWNGGDQAP